jgi:hypothetical protein
VHMRAQARLKKRARSTKGKVTPVHRNSVEEPIEEHIMD